MERNVKALHFNIQFKMKLKIFFFNSDSTRGVFQPSNQKTFLNCF
jgi:hypothetical protein